MTSSWLKGTLTSLFGRPSDTRHWIAVMKVMEESFGTIIFDTPPEDGQIHAYFAKQTLVGDDTLSLMPPHTIEAIGTGRNCEDAMIDLWDKMTSLALEEYILQPEYVLCSQEEEPTANYHRFQFIRGIFKKRDEVLRDAPPPRADYIQKTLSTVLSEDLTLPPPHI